MQTINNIQELLAAKAEQINNKRDIDVYGKAAEYKRLLTICKFKLVVWFNKNKFGQPYTIYDKQNNKNINRHYIPSFDTINSIGGTQVIEHEIAHTQLINYCLQNAANIDKAILIVMDYTNNEELTIFNFNAQNIIASRYVHPVFKLDEYGNNFYNGLHGLPLRRDKLRVYEYDKTNAA